MGLYRQHCIPTVNDAPLRCEHTGGPAYYFATLNKQNTLVQEKPLDPTWNKEIFSEIFF